MTPEEREKEKDLFIGKKVCFIESSFQLVRTANERVSESESVTARLNGKIVCRIFYYFSIIFPLFFNQNGANSLASLCEKKRFFKNR